MGTEVPKGDFGQPIQYDPNFNGPAHKRSCTDIICLIVFTAFIVCWGCVCGYAFIEGNVSMMLAPTDSNGSRCGFSDPVKSSPYLVFFDFTECLSPDVPLFGCKTRQMCVNKCPQNTINWEEVSKGDSDVFNRLKNESICLPSVDTGSMTQPDFIGYLDRKECAKYSFRSTSISKRCMPSNISEVIELVVPNFVTMPQASRISVEKEFTSDFQNGVSKINELGALILEDIINLKWWLLLVLFVVMIICMIYIVVLRWIAAPLVWFSLIAVLGLLSWSIYLCCVKYIYYRDSIEEPELITSAGSALESFVAMKETWIVLLILSCIVLAIVLLMIIFLRKRIVIAIALIKEGSKAVSSVFSTLFFPVFPWIFQILILALAVSACLYLVTIGEDTFQVKRGLNEQCEFRHGDRCLPLNFTNSGCVNSTCIFTGVTNPPIIGWMQAWNVIGFFWSLFFIQGVADMILAGTFATWYWTFHKNDLPYFTLTQSVFRTMFFNLGTVAFGSLIITICRLIRVMIEYVDQQCKKYDNFFTKCLICCCRCFFACLESFLRFINKNAYIMCAVHGKGFCSSARKAFNLLMRNILRVVVLDKVTDFLFFLSKLVIAIGCGAATYFIFIQDDVKESLNLSLNYDLVPALIVGVVAYFIASIFFGVYSMAVDTLFLCFLEDIERNDGSPERPYFMSKNLMKILGKKNK